MDADTAISDPAISPSIRTTTGIQYALAIFYFLVGLMIIIAAALIPSLSDTAIGTFVLLGFLVLLAGLVHILSVPDLSCIPPESG